MTSVTLKTVAELDEMRARALARRGSAATTDGTAAAVTAWVESNWEGYIPYVKAIREADAAAGLTTVQGFDTATAPHEWQPIETAPKNGTPIWAYLFESGVRLVRWMSAEESAETYGGTAENYYGTFVEVRDVDEEWSPKYWLPADALPPVPEAKPGMVVVEVAED